MARRLQIYEAPGITVTFDPGVCKHSGVCVLTLPAVFDVRRARWIRADAAPADDVAAAVQKCPSGALQFYRNVDRDPAAASRLAKARLLNHLAVLLDATDSREETAKALGAALAAERGYDFVGLYDLAGGEFVVVGWTGEAPAHPRFDAGKGLCGAAASSGETVMVNDVSNDPRYLTTTGAIRSEMIVPVADPATRAVVGTIDVASSRTNAFGDEDRVLVEDCARVMLRFWMEP
jgi:GAF domain-containing protein